MANHFHTCQHCDDRYPGDTLLVEVDDRGGMACTCRVLTACQVCAPELYKPVCAKCEEDGVYTRATEQRHGEDLCANCAQIQDEAAHERSLSDYYGASGAVSINEQMQAAYAVKRSQR